MDTFLKGGNDERIGNELKHTASKTEQIKNNPYAFYNGKIYILTSHATFSAAVMVAHCAKDNNLATIVGEIPGNSPTHFGNVVHVLDDSGNDMGRKDFETPNSKLSFRTTYMKFYRTDETKDGKRLIHDIKVPAKDALRKVYEIIKK